MRYLSQYISSWLCKQGAIDEDDKEIYEYSAYCILITIIPLIVVLIISAIIGGIKQYIVMLFPFVCLREYCGGYHTKRAWVCMISSIFILVLMVWAMINCINKIFDWEYIFLASVSIIINCPIESENRRLDESEKILYRKRGRLLLFSFLLLEAIMKLCLFDVYAEAIGAGIILVFISQMPCVLKKIAYKIEGLP